MTYLWGFVAQLCMPLLFTSFLAIINNLTQILIMSQVVLGMNLYARGKVDEELM